MRRVVWLGLLAGAAACAPEKNQAASEPVIHRMDDTVYNVAVRSKISSGMLVLGLPKCFYAQPEKLAASGEQQSPAAFSVELDMPRLAFSETVFKAEQPCTGEGYAHGASVRALSPKALPHDKNIFPYFVNEAVRGKAVYLGRKNRMALYRISPLRNGIFPAEGFPGLKRPIMIDFAAPREDKDSPFGHVFNVQTIIRNEYVLRYTVFATPRVRGQFAEALRQALEKKQPVLEHPELVERFVQNNEQVAAYFERHSIVR